MTVTIALTPELEAKLEKEAARQGVDAAAFVARALEERLRGIADRLPAVESELLRSINIGLSDATWDRYHTLTAKRKAEALSREEHSELIKLSDQLELANARRMRYIIELARSRNTSPESLMKELGILSSPASPHG